MSRILNFPQISEDFQPDFEKAIDTELYLKMFGV